ncbi:hypothetical protein CC2G_001644 [Coprinopsis cinerea AmutBmut pab1-1]|nr:hypothetical protein CC2G_001644 [Coprinopsis cinerea AmutBmut pab1-1]
MSSRERSGLEDDQHVAESVIWTVSPPPFVHPLSSSTPYAKTNMTLRNRLRRASFLGSALPLGRKILNSNGHSTDHEPNRPASTMHAGFIDDIQRVHSGRKAEAKRAPTTQLSKSVPTVATSMSSAPMKDDGPAAPTQRARGALGDHDERPVRSQWHCLTDMYRSVY